MLTRNDHQNHFRDHVPDLIVFVFSLFDFVTLYKAKKKEEEQQEVDEEKKSAKKRNVSKDQDKDNKM